jgi:dTDP-4-dehydrorhamnose 3,5-epimerase
LKEKLLKKTLIIGERVNVLEYLENNSLLNYKCTNYYAPEYERAILWNDDALAIDWGIDNPIISEKDKLAMPFKDFDSPI